MAAPVQTEAKSIRTDRSFDTGKIAGYSLALQAAANGIRFAVLDDKGHRFIVLGDLKNSAASFSAGLNEQVRSFENFLDGICTQVPWITGPFGNKRISWEGPHSTLVPAPLALREEMWEYLAFGHKLEAGETVLSDRLESPDAFNIFSVPEKIRELLSLRFGTGRLYHHSTSFIAGLLSDHAHRQGKPVLYAWLSGHAANLALADRDGLKIHNRFAYTAPEDVIYYLIYILQQFSVDPATARVVLTGQVSVEDALWKQLGKYIGDPVILPGIPDIHPGKDLEDAPVHEWFPLLNLFRCGS
jgi:hypothetical protein